MQATLAYLCFCDYAHCVYVGVAGSSVKWQEWVDTSSQLEAVGHLAAHVHITTIELLNRCHGGNVGNLVSPRTFIECLKMTKCLAVTIKQKGKVR